MSENNFKVFASVRAVPNGRWKDSKGQEWCRLSLVVNPIVAGGSAKLTLVEWPSQIIRLLTGLKLASHEKQIPAASIRVQVPKLDGLSWVPLDQLAAHLRGNPDWPHAANRIWKQAFAGKVENFHKALGTQQMLKDDPENDKGNADGDAKNGEPRRPAVGLNSLIEDDDPSPLAQVAVELQSAAALLSLNFGKVKVKPASVTWERFGHSTAIEEPDLISKWMTHARPAAAFEAAKFDNKAVESVLVQRRDRGRGDESGTTVWNPEIDGVLTDEVADAVKNVPTKLRKTQDAVKKDLSEGLPKLISGAVADITAGGPIKFTAGPIKTTFSDFDEGINKDPDHLRDAIRGQVVETFSSAIWIIGAESTNSRDVRVLGQLRSFGNGPTDKDKKHADVRIGEYLVSKRPSGLRKMSPPAAKLKAGEKPTVREDFELRKLTAIANYPRLARFMATTIDVDFKAEELPGDYMILFPVLDPDVPKQFQSATLCYSGDGAFRPIDVHELGPRGGFNAETSEYRDGFLNLAMKRTLGRGNRFALKSLDMRASVESTLRMGQEVASDKANRVPDAIIDKIAPELRSIGISLIDRDRRAAAIKDQALAIVRNEISRKAAQDETEPGHFLIAGDLADGLRFDIGFRDVTHEGKYEGEIEWRAAGGREIAYQDTIQTFLPKERDTRDRRRPWLRDLDEATIQTPLQIKRSPENPDGSVQGVGAFMNQNETSVLASSIVQNYEGWSLGLPARASVSNLTDDELPVSIFYGHPQSRTRSPSGRKVPNTIAKMKFGREFYMRARISYVGGGGLSWRDAYDLYEAEKAKKPEERTIPTSEPHVFRRFERVKAPLVLLYEPLDGSEPSLRVRLLYEPLDGSEPGLRVRKQKKVPTAYEGTGAEPVEGLGLADAGKNAGSQIRHLVVRSFADPRRSDDNVEGSGRARRVLVADEVPVDLADMHDVFADHNDDGPPPGAFPDLRLLPKMGEFPTVDDPDGRLTDFEPGDRLGRKRDEQNRIYTGRTSDQIAIPERRRKEPENPYYPDPLAQRLMAAWVPDYATNLSQVTIRSAKFYEDPTRPVPREALVHLIEVIRGKDPKTKFTVDKAKPASRDWKRILAEHFRLEIPPAEQGELHLWCVTDDQAFREADEDANMATHPNTLEILPTMATTYAGALYKASKTASPPNRQQAPMTINGQSIDLLVNQLREKPETILQHFRDGFKDALPPIPNLFPSISMGVVHAIQKPMKAPMFMEERVGRTKHPAVALVFLKVASEGEDPASVPAGGGQGSTDIRDAFRAYLSSGPTDRSRWESQIDGSEAFIAGTLEYHQASTDKLQVWARWYDYGKDAIQYDAKTDLYSHEPVERLLKLCELDQLGRPDVKLDMSRITIEGDKDVLQIKTPDIEPGFARKLKIFIRGFSRYASYFPEIAAAAENQDSETPKDAGPFARDSVPVSYCVKSCRRPPPPEILKIEPAARTEMKDWTGNQRQAETHYVQRVYLKNWGTLGNEEQLAVILPPRDRVRGWESSNRKIEDFRDLLIEDAELKKLRDIVTLWGADSTEESGRLADLVSPGHFQNAVGVLDVDLPVNVSITEDGTSFQSDLSFTTGKATVVLFTPQVEATTGRWYCDIDVRSHAAHAFIQFGFARYQPKSVEGARISTPVGAKWCQTRPNRDVGIERIRKNGKDVLEITVTGIGYTQKLADWEDLELAESDLRANPERYDVRDRFQWPEMRARMIVATEGRREGLQVVDPENGQAVCSRRLSAKFAGWSRFLPNRREPRLQWQFVLPDPGKPRKGESRYLILTERDIHAADPDEPAEIKRHGSRIAERPAGIIRVELD